MLAPKILLIDPSRDTRDCYQTLLSVWGYRVITARTPEEGVVLAQMYLPDLIITELFTRTETGWSGPEMVRSAFGDSVPLVVVTSRPVPNERASSREEVRIKPPRPAELEPLVRRGLALVR